MSTVTEHETTLRQNGDGAPATPVAETSACPSCGAATEPGQLMCLECGARLALDYQRAPSWRLPAAIVAAVVLLAGLGVMIALAAVTNDADRTTAAAPTQTAPDAAPADTAPTTPQSTPTATEPTPAPAEGETPATGDGGTAAPEASTSPAPDQAAEGWPPGKSAFTVILASVETEEGAKQKAEAARAAGIGGAAILKSDDFPTLRPGYWVVFDGQYDTIEQAGAQAEADRAKGEFSDAYPRFVSKTEDAQP